jgi:hypothetical protein
MNYLCLAYYDEEKFETLSESDLDALGRECRPHDEELRKTGRLVATGSLQPARSAKIVRPRNGKVSVTDGPFAETKEQVGGFFILEAADLDEAIRLASLHPAALMNEHLGWGIEVRPIDFFSKDALECRIDPDKRQQA